MNATKKIVLLIILLNLLNIVDATSTHYHLNNGGSEANPIMKQIIKNVGTTFSMLLKTIIIIPLSTIMLKKKEEQPRSVITTLIILNALFSIVLLNNALKLILTG